MNGPESTLKHYAPLLQLFGDNRAEWPSDHFGELFVKPTYLQKLETMRPCFLVGGRGTGKTTALQSLRYDATLERLQSIGLSYGDQEYLGILVRMNKNRVRAFNGGGVPQQDWIKAFAHYFNLIVSEQFARMGIWLESMQNTSFAKDATSFIATELGLEECETLSELQVKIKQAISKLQLYVNNPHSSPAPIFSMAESPLKHFAEALREQGLIDSQVIFCCIDEYENLLDYQQSVLNTYIKHAEPPLSYKVGVRKNGLRKRNTLDSQDLLQTPDDFAEIEIVEEGFEYFAKEVAELRLRKAIQFGISVPEKLDEFLADLSFSEEAKALGAQKVATKVLEELKSESEEAFLYFSKKDVSETYFLKFWQDGSGGRLDHLAHDWINNETAWKTRLGNHGYASLFWLSKGNKGKRIRKYYCGTNVFLSLPGGNVRYFLELLENSVSKQLDKTTSITKLFTLSPEAQTKAAEAVGRRRLNQLEGLADHGVQLKRLVLAIGKVFFEFARDPAGRTPEVNSFVLNGSASDVERLQALLSEGVGHLAFEQAPRTKATTDFEPKDDEYRLHRIFCAFFVISHRKKRRTTFEARHLLDVLESNPSRAIARLLGDQQQLEEDALPEQLAFFNAFYEGGDQE